MHSNIHNSPHSQVRTAPKATNKFQSGTLQPVHSTLYCYMKSMATTLGVQRLYVAIVSNINQVTATSYRINSRIEQQKKMITYSTAASANRHRQNTMWRSRAAVNDNSPSSNQEQQSSVISCTKV